MHVGLLGKANVGKSTFFAAATESIVPVGNFPFTTVSPNVGVTHVKTDCACKHFKIRHQHNLCQNGVRLVPIKLIDVAGLVPGAHQGKGLGNQFLDDARQASVLIHVVDAAGSTDAQGMPVSPGTRDPTEDIQFVQEEFDLWFLDIIKREWEKISREIDQKRAKLADGIASRFTGLGVTESDVQSVLQRSGKASVHPKMWSDNDIYDLVRNLRQATKPILIAANKIDICADISSLEPDAIPCCAEAELALRRAAKAKLITYRSGDHTFRINSKETLSTPQRKALYRIQTMLNKIKSTGVQETLNRAIFDTLGLIPVFPVEDETRLTDKKGVILPDVKLMSPGATAKDLAYKVHTDIGAGFLYAVNCKTKQRIGADYTLEPGDVIKIVSTAGL